MQTDVEAQEHVGQCHGLRPHNRRRVRADGRRPPAVGYAATAVHRLSAVGAQRRSPLLTGPTPIPNDAPGPVWISCLMTRTAGPALPAPPHRVCTALPPNTTHAHCTAQRGRSGAHCVRGTPPSPDVCAAEEGCPSRALHSPTALRCAERRSTAPVQPPSPHLGPPSDCNPPPPPDPLH